MLKQNCTHHFSYKEPICKNKPKENLLRTGRKVLFTSSEQELT